MSSQCQPSASTRTVITTTPPATRRADTSFTGCGKAKSDLISRLFYPTPLGWTLFPLLSARGRGTALRLVRVPVLANLAEGRHVADAAGRAFAGVANGG